MVDAIKKVIRAGRPMFPEDGPPLPAGFGVRWPFAPEKVNERPREYTGFKFILRDIADKIGIKEYWWE